MGQRHSLLNIQAQAQKDFQQRLYLQLVKISLPFRHHHLDLFILPISKHAKS
jgi:hypothetical protein